MASFDFLRQLPVVMTPIELSAAILVLVNVWLVARRSVWNYAFGLAGVALYGWVFFVTRLYSDMLLQGFFLVLNVYGLIQWRRSQAEAGEVVVEHLSPAERVRWAIGIAVAVALWGWLMHRFTNAALPWWDAGVAMISVAAQLLMARRMIENWWLWILADALAVGLYSYKSIIDPHQPLWVTTILYVILLGLAIWGLARWQAARQGSAA